MDCKRCGARLPQGILICPECGARQSRQARFMRCARCGKRALVDLRVCPHCGRTLRPAGPRWGLWLAGTLALVLVGLLVLNRLPVRAAWQQVLSLEERLTGLVQIPELPAAPATVARPAPAAGQAGAAIPAAARPTSTGANTAAPRASLGLSVTLTVIRPTPTSEATAVSTQSTSADSGDKPTPQLPTQPPTATPQPPTETPQPPTATPVPPTPTPEGDTTRYYTVRAGDTFIDIGIATGIDWQDIAAYNGMTSRSLMLPGMKLKLPPAAGSQPAQTAAPTAAPAQAQPRTYRVQAGDTLMAIGNRFGVSWQSIAQANGLTAYSTLQVGQELKIPAN